MLKSRPSWDEYALRLAQAAMSRSEDPWQQVGAAALRHDNSVAATGYNGVPPGITIDWTNRDARRVWVIHAERNCLNYVLPGDCKLLACTLLPCPECLKEIAIKRIKRVVYADVYKTDPEVAKQAFNFADRFEIELVQLPIPSQENKLP